ncbi:MAG: 3-oxoacyl-ACP reductase FabG [Clostridia bacterium]|nr:3-oxoacyl-ACP reductase FabG [Clostridia bacterium]
MKKTVIVTGASSGIGSAIADAFAMCGHNVVIGYNNSAENARILEKNLLSKGCSVASFKADVSDSVQAQALIDFAKETFGGQYILVNNAGIAQQKLFTDITDDDFDTMFNVNVKSVFNCSRAVLPLMIHEKWGRIINISSMWGVCGASCEVHYSASKAAVIGLTKALAKEVGPSGITVNCIAPGLIDTPMNKHLDKETIADLCEETPVGRIGTPEDVAKAVLFLAEDTSSFVTGQVLGVDGGFI